MELGIGDLGAEIAQQSAEVLPQKYGSTQENMDTTEKGITGKTPFPLLFILRFPLPRILPKQFWP